MLTSELNKMADRIHHENRQWWHSPDGTRLNRDRGELLMLVVTELSEAVEGIRRDLMDDKLPDRTMEEVEMADAMIRLLDYAAGFRIPLDSPDCYTTLFQSSTKAGMILDITLAVCRIYDTPWSVVDVSFAIALICRYCEVHRLDLWGAVMAKRAYNLTRADHQHENRSKPGGKKF